MRLIAVPAWSEIVAPRVKSSASHMVSRNSQDRMVE